MPPGNGIGAAIGVRNGHGGVDEARDVLAPRRELVPRFDPVREKLHRFAEVVSREFNDEAPFGTTLSRLVNLYRRIDLPMAEFAECFDTARQQTKERTAVIHRPVQEGTDTPHARKNKIPYFFAMLEDLLGLRQRHPHAASGQGHEDPLPQDVPADTGGDAHTRYPGARTGSERNQRSVGSPASTNRSVDAIAPAADVEDARMIREVVREFSRQFADAEAAAALGDWAVTLWQDSGLSRRRFLDAAQIASSGMGQDRTFAASGPLFRSRLATMLRAKADDKRVDAVREGQLSLQFRKGN